MVGTKQKGDLFSSAKNVAVGDQGFRKALGNHVSIVAGETPAAIAVGRQDPVFTEATHAQAKQNEMPLTWV